MGRLDEAADALREAFKLVPFSSAACNLGRVELVRRRYRDAAELLTICIEIPSPVRTEEEKKRFLSLTELLAEARAKVVALLIRVNEPRASILLDGRIAASPPLPRVLFVEPGRHLVTATLDGFAPASSEIRGDAGDSLDVALTLSPLPPEPKPKPKETSLPAATSAPPPPLLPRKVAPTPPQPPPPEPSSRKTVGIILGASGGTLAVVGAISLGFAASARASMLRESREFQDERGACVPDGCGAPEATTSYVAASAVGITGVAIGGVLGVVGGYVGLSPQPSAPRTASALSTVAEW